MKLKVADREAAKPFAGCFTRDQEPSGAGLVFVGLPDDSQSSYRRGCRKAPDRIRSAYNENSYNATTELGVDLTGRVQDLGNLPSQDGWEKTAQTYREFAESLLRDRKTPFFAGGDHAVTVPLVEALAALNEPVHVLQIDAHPDLYPEFYGSLSSHACTAARILEMEHVHGMTQVGIRTLNKPQKQVAVRHRDRVRIITARDYHRDNFELGHISDNSSVYLTFDLDSLDPAYAPGVSHPVPGGLTTRQVLDIVQNMPGKLVGMDAVEVNPDLDVNDQTSILAAKILHEAMGKAVMERA